MESIHELIDEYLRVTTRTRPWSKRREAAALALFTEWLHEHGLDTANLSRSKIRELAQQCCEQCDLSGAEAAELCTVVSCVSQSALQRAPATHVAQMDRRVRRSKRVTDA